MPRPPRESAAPIWNSGWPPVPLIIRAPNTLSELIWPVRSTESALFIAKKLSFWAMVRRSSTYSGSLTWNFGLLVTIFRSSTSEPDQADAIARLGCRVFRVPLMTPDSTSRGCQRHHFRVQTRARLPSKAPARAGGTCSARRRRSVVAPSGTSSWT
jgi:hypothetical protein